MLSIRNVFNQLRDHHQYFLVTMFLGAVVGFFRVFSLEDPLSMALSGGMFLVGVFLAHLVFLFDRQLHQVAHARIPVGEISPAQTSTASPLRKGLLLILLPLLAIFMITSTRAALGLGFFWGFSSIYWWDLRSFFLNLSERQRILDTYFDQFPDQSLIPQGITLAYLVYGLVLTGFLLVLRGMP